MNTLLVRTPSWICALPIAAVAETMRALPVRAIDGAPRYIRGLAILRGAPVPVIDLALLLGERDGGQGARFVSVRAGPRQLALAVDEVLGVRRLDAAAFDRSPPLLSGTLPECVERLGALDGQMLGVLEASRLVPEDVWAALRGAA